MTSPANKVAIVILADTKTEEGPGRAYNALTAAKEFHEAGDRVKVRSTSTEQAPAGPLNCLGPITSRMPYTRT